MKIVGIGQADSQQCTKTAPHILAIAFLFCFVGGAYIGWKIREDE